MRLSDCCAADLLHFSSRESAVYFPPDQTNLVQPRSVSKTWANHYDDRSIHGCRSRIKIQALGFVTYGSEPRKPSGIATSCERAKSKQKNIQRKQHGKKPLNSIFPFPGHFISSPTFPMLSSPSATASCSNLHWYLPESCSLAPCDTCF
jgi:hypothetical protein